MSIHYTAEQLQRKFQGSSGSAGFPRIAEVLREEGRLEEAVGLCREALGRKPGSVTGHLVLGKCYADLDRLDEARESFENVLRLDPRCLSAMHHLARIMVKLQWPEAAAAYYRSILELEPWDTETLARLRGLAPAGAGPRDADFSGTVAAMPEGAGFAGAPAAPVASFPPEVPAAQAAGVALEEFDLDKVADFLPAEANPSELAGALEEVSLEDALSARPSEPARPLPPASTPADFAEPRPMDVLTEASVPAVEAGADAPAPISGDDVGERLDSLFGAQDDAPMVGKASSAPALPASEDFLMPASAATGAFAAADVSGATDANGELIPPEDRVSGDDIERRLDDLFSLPDETGIRPVMAEPAAAETAASAPAADATVFEAQEPDLGAASGTWAPAAADQAPLVDSPDLDTALGRIFGEEAEAKDTDATAITHAFGTSQAPSAPEAQPEPETASTPEHHPYEAPTDDLAIASGPDAGPRSADSGPRSADSGPRSADSGPRDVDYPGDAGGEVVTGQDVADKLEALFGEEPAPRKSAEAGSGPTGSTADPLPTGSASWAAARPAGDETLSLEEPAGIPGTASGPALDLPAPDEASVAGSPAFLPKNDWEESLEASQPPSTDLLSTESMLPRGMGRDSAPPVTGKDIEDRLDSLFDLSDEGTASGSVARAPVEPAMDSLDGFLAPEASPAGAAEVTPEEPAGEATAEPPLASDSEPAFTQADADRTLMMPAMRETASDWLARRGEETAAGPKPSETESAGPKAPEVPGQAQVGNDTLFMNAEELYRAEAPAESLVSAGTDTVGMEMVDGADVAGRLDQLFASEEAAAAAARSALGPIQAEGSMPFGGPDGKAAAEAAIASGEATLDGEATLPLDENPAVETGELPLDEVALFAQDPEAALSAQEPDLVMPTAAETMVSGEDVRNRLSELFEEPTGVVRQSVEGTESPAGDMPESSGWQTGSAGTAEVPAVFEEEEARAALEPEDRAMDQAAAQEEAGMPPNPASPAPGRASATRLAPLQDEEEGSPEEDENAPQSAAGANVATVTLAEIYFQQGLREQALQIYRQLLEREPGNESVRNRIQEIEASKPEAGPGPGSDQRRPRPGLKVPKRKK